mmetsp:Transcript_17715/g.49583  ORF Transcript_17715/g.49583 Transcript_17715/m.49583 type:complete len:195 (-) Transcript_17715:175-759(-)|eukprot:CAMPEP_0117682668 /NCGR_PEP_ID=MMETSP0804-20121206/19830_1 /TAXON_ID=1074897 /ORGANISM="Tetraselmis astigmatica, Strain CCMP880" /LENGTH=194 /DNA_ID=CAMNT_0005492891 /DNA_START=224 /DNA_END=808 /DNA_ORIENTATION=-
MDGRKRAADSNPVRAGVGFGTANNPTCLDSQALKRTRVTCEQQFHAPAGHCNGQGFQGAHLQQHQQPTIQGTVAQQQQQQDQQQTVLRQQLNPMHASSSTPLEMQHQQLPASSSHSHPFYAATTGIIYQSHPLFFGQPAPEGGGLKRSNSMPEMRTIHDAMDIAPPQGPAEQPPSFTTAQNQQHSFQQPSGKFW